VKQIEDPSAFGVVQLDTDGHITDFVEKPQTFVSDLAMIGIYYFKHGESLREELNYLIDNEVIKSGEYQLPDALRRMTEKGTKFVPGEVSEWLDCGNKSVTVHTNQRVLEFDRERGVENIAKSAKLINTVVIPPCFIGEHTHLTNSVIGPHVSIGANSRVSNSVVSNSLIQENVHLDNVNLAHSMIGLHSTVMGKAQDLSIGDYTTIHT